MVRRKEVRRRPSTPEFSTDGLKTTTTNNPFAAAADPASPPETPTTSPPLSRKISLKPRHQPPFGFTESSTQDPAIRPVGSGHQFSYRPATGLDHPSSPPSPLSSNKHDGANSAVADLSDRQSVGHVVPSVQTEPSDGEESSPSTSSSAEESESSSEDEPPRVSQAKIRITSTTMTGSAIYGYNLLVEEVDPMDSENEGLDVFLPTEIESSRSRSRPRQMELDKGMMEHLERLKCDAEDDGEAELDGEIVAFFRRREEVRRLRRVSMSSSCGKRTHSEMSCDSDGEDGGLDVNDMGSSAWRMRKRLHRTSLLFHDPPAPRIDELDEPDSSEDEFAAGQSLAMELPYWASMDVVQVESP